MNTNFHEWKKKENRGSAYVDATHLRRGYGVAGGATGDSDCADFLSTNGQLLLTLLLFVFIRVH